MSKLSLLKELLMLTCEVGKAKSLGLFAAYLDDSHGSIAHSGYLAIAGCIADASEIQRMAKVWQAVLDYHEMDYFHASDFSNPNGKYKEWSPDRVACLMKMLCHVITCSKCSLVGACVSFETYAKVQKRFSGPPVSLMKPEHYCLDCSLQSAVRSGIRNPEIDPIAVWIESGFDHGSLVWKMWKEELNKKVQGEPSSKFNLSELATAPKTQLIPLQFADLAAYEMWKFFDQNIGRGKRNLRKSMSSIQGKWDIKSVFKPERAIIHDLNWYNDRDLRGYYDY